MLQKGPETKKKFGIEPTAEVVDRCYLRGFDRNAQQLFTVFSLHQCLQHAAKNEQKQLLINHHSQVPR